MFAFLLVYFVGVARAGVFGLLEVLEVWRVARFWVWDYPATFPPQLTPKNTLIQYPKQSKKTRTHQHEQHPQNRIVIVKTLNKDF